MKTRPWLIPTAIVAGAAIVGTTAWYIHRRLKNSQNNKPQKPEETKPQSQQEIKLEKSAIVLKERETYSYVGDTVINSSIPAHAKIRVLNGNLTIKGYVGPSATIFIEVDPLLVDSSSLKTITIEGCVHANAKIDSLRGGVLCKGMVDRANINATYSVKCESDIKDTTIYCLTGFLTITATAIHSSITMDSGYIKINQAILGSKILNGKGRIHIKAKDTTTKIECLENGEESETPTMFCSSVEPEGLLVRRLPRK